MPDATPNAPHFLGELSPKSRIFLLVPVLFGLFWLGLLISDPISNDTIGFNPFYGVAIALVLLLEARALVPIVLATTLAGLSAISLGHWQEVASELIWAKMSLTVLSPILTLLLIKQFRLSVPYFRSTARFALIVFVSAILAPSLIVVAFHMIGRLVEFDSAATWLQFILLVLGSLYGVVLYTPLVYLYLRREIKVLNTLQAVVQLIVLSVMLVIFTYYAAQVEQVTRKFEMTEIAERIAGQVDNDLTRVEEAISAIAMYLSGEEPVSKQSFQRYVAPFLAQHKGISISWNPKVTDLNHDEILQQLRADDPNLTIVKANQAQNEQDHVQRLEDFGLVVLFIAPEAGNEKALGFDIYSNAERRIAINQAIDGNNTTATEPITLVQNGHVGVLLISPVSLREQNLSLDTINELKGVVVGVVDIQELFSALPDLYDGVGFQVYESFGGSSYKVYEQGTQDDQKKLKDLTGIANIDWAGRTWQIEVLSVDLRWHDSTNILRIWLPILVSILMFWAMSIYLATQYRFQRTDNRLQAKTQLLEQLGGIQLAFMTNYSLLQSLKKLTDAILHSFSASGVSIYTVDEKQSAFVRKYSAVNSHCNKDDFIALTEAQLNFAQLSSLQDDQNSSWFSVELQGDKLPAPTIMLAFPIYFTSNLVGVVVLCLPKEIASNINYSEYKQLLMTAAGLLQASQERDKQQSAYQQIKNAMEAKLQAQIRTRQQGDALANLVQHPTIVAGNWTESIQQICWQVSKVLNADRVSVWTFSEDYSQLVCESLFIEETNTFETGATIKSDEIPAYFSALKKHSRISAADVMTHPATIELAKNYLLTHGVKSMLDACIVKDGEIVGVVCVEELKIHREWQVDEENFVTVMAGLVAQLFFKEEISLANELSRYQSMERAIILDTIPHGLATVNLAGQLENTNSAFRTLFQLDEGSVATQNIDALLPVFAETSIVAMAELNMAAEIAGRRSDGTHFPALLNLVKLPSSQSEDKFLVFIRDLTEQREQEQLLFQSQKLEALGQLTGAVAHDFNNILGIIVGYGQLLSDQLEGSLKNHGEKIVEAGERAKTLIKQLLVFSSKNAKQLEFADLVHIIQNIEPTLQRLMEGRHLTIECDCDEAVALIERDQIEHVLVNIVVNAVHATDNNGTIAIRLSLKPVEQTAIKPDDRSSNVYVELTISDNGVGIPDELKTKIFEPFLTTKGKDGTGLGLAQAMAYMTQLGGNIICESVVGRGSEFKLYFPTQQKPADAKKLDLKTNSVNKRILVVDDEELLLRLFATQLRKFGYEVFIATNIAEAITLLNKQAFDLVLSDIQILEESGLVLANYVRHNCPECKTLLMSGFSDQEGEDEYEKALISSRLIKPFTESELKIAISNLL